MLKRWRLLLNEDRKARLASGERKRLSAELYQESIDDHVRKVFDNFHTWLELYRAAERFFYSDLLGSISEGYNLDSMFHMRGDSLGLSKSVLTSLDSHFRRDSFNTLNMSETVAKIADMGGMGGEPGLLEKQPEGLKVYPGDPGDNLFYPELGKQW